MKLNKAILSIFSKNKNKTGLLLTFKNVIEYIATKIHTWENGSSVYYSRSKGDLICCGRYTRGMDTVGFNCFNCCKYMNICTKCLLMYDVFLYWNLDEYDEEK